MEAVKGDLGFIGLGVMGSSMARHLLEAGYRLHVYTRTRAKAEALLQAGAFWEESPAAVAACCPVVFSMVGYPQDVRSIYLDIDGGMIGAARPGSILVDMTTSRPDLAVELYEKGRARGIQVLDAPVSGGDIGARNATLTIMTGGDEAAFEAVKPLLALMGQTIRLQGPAGSGQHTKMANQISLASCLAGAVEAMTYVKAAGLDPRSVLASISTGAAGSWQLANNAPRMLDGNFAPGFYVRHFLKDLRIALDAAKDMGLSLPFLELAESLFARLEASGRGDLGTQALYLLYGERPD